MIWCVFVVLYIIYISTNIRQKGLSDMVYTTGQVTVKEFDNKSTSVPMTIW